MDAGAVAALLELQMEWGVDVLLDEESHDRFAAFREEQAARGTAVAERAQVPLAEPVSRRLPDITPMPVAVSASEATDKALAGIGTVEALGAAIDGFTACSLRGTATNTVLARGPVGARVMVIGDAPDADEDRSGEVFSGHVGGLLDRMLASIGLHRKDMVLSPAIPWRPPGGRPPSPAEVELCRPFLLRSIVVHRPERLLLCGGLAVRMLLGPDVNPARARGCWRIASLEENGGMDKPVLATRHPSQLRAGASARREIWDDLLLLAVTLDDIAGDADVMME
ncbi:uracil-DNA glycosylase [Acetobacter conturbans]|uniref:Uracil-DNA glycosylase n=1 Tax=Acetobacter conturbans TaxID=1737472 RepID=A0ABX0K202_9PROT|nr:uracil-DNA glycosylase [Acetobacter conturbans]NHN88690.1 uracil-DNA glycosylase [Acetobacter conturbans]